MIIMERKINSDIPGLRHPRATAMGEPRKQRAGLQVGMPRAFKRSRKRSLKGGSPGHAGAISGKSGNPVIQISGPPLPRGRRIKQPLFGLSAGILLAFALSTATAAPLAIPLYHATYSVNRNDLHLGNAQFSLTRNANGTYAYKSVTRASGLASLFFSDVITELSYFEVNGGHLQPLLYRYSNTNHHHDREQTIHFYWNKSVAYSADGGHHRTFPIKLGILDRALAQLALSVDMAAGHLPKTYTVLDHNKINSFHLQRVGKATLKTSAGKYNTMKVARDDAKKSRVTTFWLAPKLNYLPAQMQQTEPGKATITLVLTKIKFDSSKQPD